MSPAMQIISELPDDEDHALLLESLDEGRQIYCECLRQELLKASITTAKLN